MTTTTGPIVWGDTPDWRRAPTERRDPQQRVRRQAITRLRLAEFVAADYLPTELMQELTAAIDGVVDIARGAK